jgi:hypothetical protein
MGLGTIGTGGVEPKGARVGVVAADEVCPESCTRGGLIDPPCPTSISISSSMPLLANE